LEQLAGRSLGSQAGKLELCYSWNAPELTEEEKAAKEAADALARKKHVARKAAELKRKADERRKEQIVALRKRALDDRATRKANRKANRFVVEAEPDDSGSDFDDFIDDDDEKIAELRGVDFLAASDSDSEDENQDTHPEMRMAQMLAKQQAREMQSYLKQRNFTSNPESLRSHFLV
jgi:hypothetical protein